MRGYRGLGVVGVLIALAGAAAAGPLPRDQVPAPLGPWVDWVLYDADEAQCPLVHGNAKLRPCSWPSQLDLTLDDLGGRFRQTWRVYRDAWVALPGDLQIWPRKVAVDGKPAVVVPRKGAPSVRLKLGRHTISGVLSWPELPASLPIPADSGLVALELRGRAVAFPHRDLKGQLWLREGNAEPAGESRLDVIVRRRVIDQIPLELETRISLEVSGASREVLLGGALPESFVPMALAGPIPARLEPDGRLRVQVRPGHFELVLRARHDGGPVDEIALARPDGPWDSDEVWVFDSQSDLRTVRVEGVPGIDPQQTTLPAGWRQLPAFLMRAGSRMRLVEQQRGDADPAPDRLQLARTLWLDFDGAGFTVHDEIKGTAHRSWRLETLPPTELGRVAVGGEDRFISGLGASPKGSRRGVEIRQGQLELDADSRMEGALRRFAAVGWNLDFQRVSAQLNLPPGWRLFHASGVDDVRATWTTRWSLFEIFLVLVTAMAFTRLSGRAWGMLALVTLALTYPEPGAPRWSWLLLLAAQALARAVPGGRLGAAARIGRLAAVAVLAIVALPFTVEQARLALDPALEFPGLSVRGEATQAPGALDEVARKRAPTRGRRNPLPEAEGLIERPLEGKLEQARGSLAASRYYAPDPTVLISTGPGLPHWGWRMVALDWRGPVTREQELHLLLIPPWGNALLGWLRVLLVGLLAVCALGQGPRLLGSLRRLAAPRGSAVLIAWLVSGALAPQAIADTIPPPEMLGELRTRLIEPPDCAPTCASIPHMRVRVEADVLRLRLEIDAAARTAVPLPGGLEQWLPRVVQLDSAPASLAYSPDGQLWISLEPGRHRVELEGPLPDRDSVQLPLPLRPHAVVARVRGWRLEGIAADGRVADSLQLTRERDLTRSGSTLAPSDLPPFVRVERTLRLGLRWRVETRVVRLTPAGSAIFLEVPLLAGESVTTEGVRVEDGRAEIELAAAAMRAGWHSVLEPTDALVLRAPEAVPWTELWRLDVAPLWHVETAGIPVVHASRPQPIRVREWRPWPGEQVTLAISKPRGVEGRTLTIDHSSLSVRPGLRTSETTLALSLRASRGVEHTVTLPEGSELLSVKLDGALQPIRALAGRVVLPIRPGQHRAEISWRGAAGIAARYRTPVVDLGAPSVNAEIELAVPTDRWVLLTGGPRLGPAVLFWSLLLVALGVALGLGRLRETPLGWASWFLLFVGLTQVPVWIALVVVGWLVALGWRHRSSARATDAAFDAMQLLLAGWTLAALAGLVWAIQQGLLGLPDMQISGNGSSGSLLRWYSDRADDSLDGAWMISVPLLVYRLAMLAWALWLAHALIGWLRWGWECFCEGGYWRPLRRRVQPVGAPEP